MFPDVVAVTVFVAGVCAALAIVISIRHINNHLTNYLMPQFQLHIVRILAMVPIYSFTSWCALVIKDESITLILDLIRDSYEAYVIYNFVILLINYGGGHLHLCRYLENEPRMHHPFPFGLYLPPLKLGPEFLSGIRASVLQFVFVKPLNSALNLYLYFNAPQSSLRSIVLIFIVIANNVSVSVALYGLVLFYHAAGELLKPFRPFEKFIAVKAVIFFSFWQGFALSILESIGIIRDMPGFSADEQTIGLQDVLICVEMAIAAITHLFVFSWTEYVPRRRLTNIGNDNESAVPSLGHVSKHPLLEIVDFRDVLSDAKDRFYGGVGFENELVDGAPIDHGFALTESYSSPSPSSVWYQRPPNPAQSSVSADLQAAQWKRYSSIRTIEGGSSSGNA